MISSELLQREQDFLTKRIADLEQRISESPPGHLHVCRTRGDMHWYHHSSDHPTEAPQRTYISRKKRALAEKLAAKRYWGRQLSDAQAQLTALQEYIRATDDTAAQLLKDSVYRDLLEPVVRSSSEVLREWVREPYDHNERYPENLKYSTGSGMLVRSKSEAMIAMMLEQYEIPYRYECALDLHPHVVYPDFTIRHPQTGELYYWEHFGMMDDSNYYDRAKSKLNNYFDNGYLPLVNMITTFETAETPLTPQFVQKIILFHFT